jgi:hypothetical protein
MQKFKLRTPPLEEEGDSSRKKHLQLLVEWNQRIGDAGWRNLRIGTGLTGLMGPTIGFDASLAIQMGVVFFVVVQVLVQNSLN